MESPIKDTVFDTRDLIKYKEYLEESLLNDWNQWQENNLNNGYEAEDIDEAIRFYTGLKNNGSMRFLVDYSSDIGEYEDIEKFCYELQENSDDFEFGTTVIYEHYFEEYCKDFVEKRGYISENTPSIVRNNIDWGSVASDMETEYTEVDYFGDSYLIK